MQLRGLAQSRTNGIRIAGGAVRRAHGHDFQPRRVERSSCAVHIRNATSDTTRNQSNVRRRKGSGSFFEHSIFNRPLCSVNADDVPPVRST